MDIGRWTSDRTVRLLLMGAAMVVLLAGMRWASELLVPLLLAATIATGALPVSDFLARHAVPGPVAVGITVVLALGGLALFGWLIALAAEGLGVAWPYYEAELGFMQQQAARWLHDLGLAKAALRVEGFDVSRTARDGLASSAAELPGLFSSIGVVLLVVIFILLEAAAFRRKLPKALESRDAEGVRRTVGEIQRYLFVKSLLSALTGLLIGLWTFALDVPHPILWGLIAFVLNFVPVIGSILAAIPAVAVALVAADPMTAVVVGAGYLGVNVAIGNFLEPMLMGRVMGLSPLVVLLSMVIWGWVLGPVGALLSVPLTMVAKIALLGSGELRWVAVLIGSSEGKGGHLPEATEKKTAGPDESDPAGITAG